MNRGQMTEESKVTKEIPDVKEECKWNKGDRVFVRFNFRKVDTWFGGSYVQYREQNKIARHFIKFDDRKSVSVNFKDIYQEVPKDSKDPVFVKNKKLTML